MSALSTYTQPVIPKENPWVQRKGGASGDESANEHKPAASPTPSSPGSPIRPILPPSPELTIPTNQEPPVKLSKRTRPPSRRIMRHVLRARVEAVKALASFFNQLAKQSADQKKVVSAEHLARQYGISDTERSAGEVIAFLKSRGCVIPSLAAPSMEGEWAAMTTDNEI